MQYNEIRSEIKTGDIVLLSGDTFLANVVEYASPSKWSHLGVAWVTSGRVFLIDAVFNKGIRIVPLSHFKHFDLIQLHIDPTDESIEFMMSHIGESYDIREAILGWLSLPFINETGWQCVEFVDEFLKLNNIDPNYEQKTPQKTADFLLKTIKTNLIGVYND
jgi:hypothetical protein